MGWHWGILAASGASAGAYELIESVILTGSQSSVTFSNLGTYSSTYKHLHIRFVARDARSGFNSSALYMRLNGDTGANYSVHGLNGTGSTVGTGGAGNVSELTVGETVGATGTANSFGAGVIDILDPYSTTKNKTVRSLSGIAGNAVQVSLRSGARFNTASTTSIDLFGLANFVSGSRFSLYGIKG